MEDAPIDRPRVLWSDEPAPEEYPTAAARSNDALPLAESPVAPGELWLMECAAIAELSALEQGVLTSAKVIIYDRVLAETVAALLPIGGYAEPTFGDDIGRCVKFVRDGWSVVRLIERAPLHADFADRARRLAVRLRAAGAPPDLCVAGLISIDTPVFQRIEARLDQVDALTDGMRDGIGRAMVFSAFGPSTARCLYLTGSNGSAG